MIILKILISIGTVVVCVPVLFGGIFVVGWAFGHLLNILSLGRIAKSLGRTLYASDWAILGFISIIALMLIGMLVGSAYVILFGN